MLRNILFKLITVVFILLLLGACNSGGGNDGQPGNSNWDTMKWDKDNWS